MISKSQKGFLILSFFPFPLPKRNTPLIASLSRAPLRGARGCTAVQASHTPGAALLAPAARSRPSCPQASPERRRATRKWAAAEEARALDTQQYQPSHYDYTHTPCGSPPPTSVSPFSAPGWPADKKDGYAPQELGAPRQVFEMPEQQYSHELLGEGHVREMQ